MMMLNKTIENETDNILVKEKREVDTRYEII